MKEISLEIIFKKSWELKILWEFNFVKPKFY